MAGGLIGEREELEGFLDWFRTLATAKVRDLPTDEAVRIATPSGMTALSIIKHLTWVERYWFGTHFAGEAAQPTDNAGSFALGPGDTTATVVAGYEAACARSRELAAIAPELTSPSVTPHWHFGIVTLRWVLLHMVEETARHVGHLDILRELTDGRTGD